jgi:hypothetical protein
MMTMNDDAIAELLTRLTRWRHASGFDPTEGRSPEIRSTGESNAAIAELRRRLDELGAKYHWDEQAREYRLDEGA